LQERKAERRKRAAEAGEGYVPPKDEDDEPIDPRIEKQMEGKLYYRRVTYVLHNMDMRSSRSSASSAAVVVVVGGGGGGTILAPSGSESAK
jgi:hypothetical protein